VDTSRIEALQVTFELFGFTFAKKMIIWIVIYIDNQRPQFIGQGLVVVLELIDVFLELPGQDQLHE